MKGDNLQTILVVDDEAALCSALKFNLEAEGFKVDTAYSAEEALSLKLTDYSLILLDIMMGEISGTQFARILKSRPETAAIPIIFCTARDCEDDMVAGLEIGADDYITKPYSIRNILARVRTVLRRTDARPQRSEPDEMFFEGLRLIESRKACEVDGVEIKMPKKEYELLHTFMSNRNQIFSREDLLERIWPDEVVVIDRVIDVHVNRLRRKLGAYGSHIVTRSGYGYGFF